MVDRATLQGLYRDHTKPNMVLEEHGERQLHKLVEIFKSFLVAKAKAAITQAQGRAILFSYGSDGTPLLTWHTVQAEHQGGKVKRKAKKSDELLVEVAFLRTTDSTGELVTAFLTKDPVPLSNGKTTWHMLPAACAFFPLIQKLGHKGIVITHYVFDRAVHSSLERKMRQRHCLYHLKMADVDGEAGGMADLLDWMVSTACANHDAQNALKWGLRLVVSNQAEVHKALFIAVESCRNSFDLIHRWLESFVVGNLWFCNRRIPHETASRFWIDLSVDGDVADQLAELGLWWHNGRLEVAKEHIGKADLVRDIVGLITSVLKFKRFGDSRWVSQGPSCRTLVLGRQLGLDELVKTIRKDPKASEY